MRKPRLRLHWCAAPSRFSFVPRRVTTVARDRSAERLRSFERATIRRLQAGVDTSRGHSNETEANHTRLHGPAWRTRGCARAVIRPDLWHRLPDLSLALRPQR